MHGDRDGRRERLKQGWRWALGEVLASRERQRAGFGERKIESAGGELTATLKLKRKVTEKKYQALIDEMFAPDAKL